MDFPPPLTPTASAEPFFEVFYHEVAARRGGVSATDLAHQGTLVIRRSGEQLTFTFSGRNRPRLAHATGDLTIFRADQINNVVSRGQRIDFSAAMAPGAPSQPFTFYAASEAEAVAIVRLLPQAKDADYLAAEDFFGRVRELPAANNPWVTVTGAILIANVAVYAFMGSVGAGWIQVESMQPYYRYGANFGALTVNGQWWRLFASMFLHYGIFHLAMNMWALFQSGQLLERLLGRRLYVLVYIGAGLAGSLMALYWQAYSGSRWSAGASGAVFGIYGALLGYMHRQKNAVPKAVHGSIVKGVLSFAGYNLIIGFVIPNIDNSAHIGGFLGGAALGWLVAVPVDGARATLIPQRLRLGAAILTVVVIAACLIARMLYPPLPVRM